MPMIRTYAEPVEDTVTVKIPREYSSYSFEVILVPCNVRPNLTSERDIHFFDSLHADWGGDGSAEEIASSIRASRQVNRLTPDW